MNAFMAIMTYAKFNFNGLMLTLIFGIRAWRATEKAGPHRVKVKYLRQREGAEYSINKRPCRPYSHCKLKDESM